MRISDWSSDVCSSDLDFPCADGLARHILLLTQRFVISDAFLTIEEARALEALAERRKGIVGRRARERHRFVTSHAAARRRGEGGGGARRSEEHTSELQ